MKKRDYLLPLLILVIFLLAGNWNMFCTKRRLKLNIFVYSLIIVLNSAYFCRQRSFILKIIVAKSAPYFTRNNNFPVISTEISRGKSTRVSFSCTSGVKKNMHIIWNFAQYFSTAQFFRKKIFFTSMNEREGKKIFFF